MTDALTRLAARAGLSPQWTDAFGRPQIVSPDVLRALLATLGLPAATDAEVAESLAALEREQAAVTPPLITADAGTPISLPFAEQNGRVRYRIRLEGGGTVEGEADAAGGRLPLPALGDAGYHRLEAGDVVATLAVAPERCFSVGDAVRRHDPRLWALAVQVYGLRRAGDGGIGDFTGLGTFAMDAARSGAAGLVMSPVHAAFSADANHFSPYSPSSRLFLNALHADPAVAFGPEAVAQAVAALGVGPDMAALEAGAYVDWPKAGPLKLSVMRHLCANVLPRRPDLLADLAAFRRDGGQMLEDHARFEALHAAQFGADPFKWLWRTWPEGLRHPRSPAVERFAQDHAEAVTFHAALQWMAARSLQAAQDKARSAGMPIGLIADLAVGADGGGSQAWGRQEEMLIGATVGAPPDLLNSIGQGWGLAAFSPRGLATGGFGMFRDMLGAVMAHAGGVRIDHVMGLSRLWLIPDGAPPAAGAYLAYPFDDMIRLVALESQRRQAIVIGEDLGTVPFGFREKLAARSILGLQVLWFERDGAGFKRASDYSTLASAVTGTHDLPTVHGWWRGGDITWRAPLGLLGEGRTEADERNERTADRAALWQALGGAGAAPVPDAPEPVLDAALDFVGRTPSPLVVVPLEDALGRTEQPNLPGTVDEHPNWRRRYDGAADTLLDAADVQSRLATLARARAAS